MGISVILVLVAALVGPFFIDWTVYRSTFETYAERALGHKVTVLGEADLRLLPAPSLSFSDVRVGEAEDPLLVVSQFNVRIELPPLLKGEIRVIDMELDRPHLALSLDESGRLDWLTARTSDGALANLPPEDVAFEKITIRDGALSIVDARSGETHRIDDGNLAVSARSLAGPFKATGSLTLDGSPYNLSIATGRAQADLGIRIKGERTPVDWAVNFAFDGMLQQSDAAPAFDGTFNIASVILDDDASRSWSSEGRFTADIAEVAVPEFEFRYGPEDRRLSVSGSADLVYAGDKRFVIRARSKQVDLDRLLGGGPQQPVEINSAGEQLVSALRAVPLPPIDGAISLDVPAVVAGGGIIQNVRLDLETMLGGWRVARLAGRLPGRTLVATQGDLGLEPAMSYRGALSISSDQPGSFLGWWRQKEGSASAMEPITLEGRLNLLPEGAALNNLRLTLAGSQARGGLAYRKPRSGPDEFSLNLEADRLDLDAIEKIAALMRPQAGSDGEPAQTPALNVSVRLRAREVVARGVDGKGLALEADYADGGVRIDRLFAEDLAGARLDVAGEIKNLFSAPEGAVAGELEARELSGLVALAGSVFPDSVFADRLAKAAGSLVPANFQGELKAAARDGQTDMTLTLDGNAGGAEAAFSAGLKGRVDDWRDANLQLSVGLKGPDGGKLLQQLGFDIIPLNENDGGRLYAIASGVPSNGLAVQLDTTIGTSGLSAEGALVMVKDADAEYDVAVSAKTEDLAPIALMAGRVLPVMTGTLPAEISFALKGRGSEVEISDAAGSVGETTFEGMLAGDLEPAPGERNRRFSGRLVSSQADLRGLTELVLGPDQWFAAGDGSSIWPTVPFGAPLLDRLDVTLQFEADRLLLDDETEISNPRAEMRLSPALMRLDGLTGAFAGGGLTGSLSVQRSDAEAAFSGRVKLDRADVRQLVWRPGNRAVASGTLDLFLEFEGAGRSISAIIAGLNGGGTFALEAGDFRGLNPQAFPLVTRAADAGLELQDDRIREVFVNHMGAGSLPFDRVDGTLTLVGGRLSARNVVVDSARAEIFGSGEVDLRSYDLDADFSLKIDPGEDAVTGAEPQVGLLFEGPADAPRRRVDIAPFTAYLTLRAFEQEVERVEKLQAEILERDRLVRELKRQRQARNRRVREAEAAALAAEELERLRIEEEARALEEQSERRIEEEAAPPADAAPIPRQQSNLQQGEEDAPFAERIRALLGEDGPQTTQSIPGPTPAAKPGSNLPPLDPPVSIDDLITQDVGAPLVLPGAQ